MDAVILVIIAVVLFLFLMFGLPLIRTERRRIRDVRSEVRKERAKVVSKRVGCENIRFAVHTRDGGTVCHVTFRLVGGEELELDLSRDDYGKLEEGSWGELRYQGKRYLGFEPLAGHFETV